MGSPVGLADRLTETGPASAGAEVPRRVPQSHPEFRVFYRVSCRYARKHKNAIF
jgi:hypothetical protein